MKNQSEQLKPTLETDALILSKGGFGITNYEWREHSRKLERERDEWYYKAHANAAFTLEARRERDEAREALREMWESGDAFLPYIDLETINRWRMAAGNWFPVEA